MNLQVLLFHPWQVGFTGSWYTVVVTYPLENVQYSCPVKTCKNERIMYVKWILWTVVLMLFLTIKTAKVIQRMENDEDWSVFTSNINQTDYLKVYQTILSVTDFPTNTLTFASLHSSTVTIRGKQKFPLLCYLLLLQNHLDSVLTAFNPVCFIRYSGIFL